MKDRMIFDGLMKLPLRYNLEQIGEIEMPFMIHCAIFECTVQQKIVPR